MTDHTLPVEKRIPQQLKFSKTATLGCSRLSDSGKDAKVKVARKVGGAGRVPSTFFMFALSQFSGPDYLGAWKRLGPPWGQEKVTTVERWPSH